MKLFAILMILILAGEALSAQDNTVIDEGNNFYRQQQYDKAGEQYQKALEQSPHNQVAKFNLANSLIRQNKPDEAGKILTDLNRIETGADLRAKSNYNQGVIFSAEKKLEESIESYKQSLRINPADQEVRENLQKALLELKKKNPPKKQEEKKKDQQQQKQQPKPKISQRDALQQLKLLEQKEKEVQERLQKNSRSGAPQPKDW